MSKEDDIYKLADYQILSSIDVASKLIPLLQTGEYYISPETRKVTPKTRSLSLDPPWIYVRPNPEQNCGFWRKILFNIGGLFPEPCLSCWKVVVRPRTVEELFKLFRLQHYHTKHYCKCGIERRDYVEADYGGYFYCQSKEDGLDVLDDVRKMVAEHISPDVPVYLKRYCTEYEVAFGPTDEIENKLSSKAFQLNSIWIKLYEEAVDTSFFNQTQPQWIVRHIQRLWLERAEEMHDLTCRKFNNGLPCPKDKYAHSVNYEREDKS